MCKDYELSLKDNNCRVYQTMQTEVSRTIISEYTKTHYYSEVNIIMIIVIPLYFCCGIIVVKPDYVAVIVLLFTNSCILPLESCF